MVGGFLEASENFLKESKRLFSDFLSLHGHGDGIKMFSSWNPYRVVFQRDKRKSFEGQQTVLVHQLAWFVDDGFCLVC